MKKKLSYIVAMLLSLILVGCGNTDTVFNLKISGTTSTVTVSHDDEEISAIEMNIASSKDGLFDLLANTSMNHMRTEAENIQGVQVSEQNSDENKELNISIDYDEINWEEFRETSIGMELFGYRDSVSKPTFDELKDKLLAKGYTVEE